MKNFWGGFEKRSEEKSKARCIGKKILIGGSLAGLGALLGAKGYASKLRTLKSQGGGTWTGLERAVFGSGKAKPTKFYSTYQGDTRFNHGGVFDHIKGEDITDTLSKSDLAKHHSFSAEFNPSHYSPAHDAYLFKNTDGSWVSKHTSHHPAKQEAHDQRLHYMATVVHWDKKPSPEAVMNAKNRVIKHQPTAKYI